MSRIWSVVCTDCKESIEVGQGWTREPADALTEGALWTDAFQRFLWIFFQKHRQHGFGKDAPQPHHLIFVDEEYDLLLDCKEFGDAVWTDGSEIELE